MLTLPPTAANNVAARIRNSQNRKTTTTNNNKTHTTATRDIICFRCFKAGRKSNDRRCPALSKTCRDYKKTGHYADSKHFCGKTTSKSTTNTVHNTSVEPVVTPTAVDSFSNLFTVRNENSYKTLKFQTAVSGKRVTSNRLRRHR